MAGRTVREVARAKVNLSLRVLGRRPDGYHELDSLVAFAASGDELHFATGSGSGFTSAGPFAAAISGPNLVEAAVTAVRRRWPLPDTGSFHLVKNLPVAAGVGGGSADAAAALRAVQRAFPEWSADEAWWHDAARQLGADVPVCLRSRLTQMRGTGERLIDLPELAPIPAVLVNPRQPLSTGDVFRELAAAPLPAAFEEAPVARLGHSGDLLAAVRASRNDLEPPARRLLPVIGDVLDAIAGTKGCEIARMSGSGPTCFGLFESAGAASLAGAALGEHHPAWWVMVTELN